MKRSLQRLIGADREKIIAVLATTREDAASCVEHARTAAAGLPIRVWCVEPGEPSAECEGWVAAATVARTRRDFQGIWPALTIVSWAGTRDNADFKLLPLLIPPFRVVVRNEAGGFFAARLLPLLKHAARRLKDGLVSVVVRAGEWGYTLLKWIYLPIWSLLWRLGDWAWSLLLAFLSLLAPLAWPLICALAARRNASVPGSLASAPPLAGPADAIEIQVADRRWRRAKLLRTLLACDTAFVVFRHPSCTADAAPLMALAVNTGAFAVARQAAYTGWRRRVTTRHPFRILAAGEMASVLAPVSNLLVIRRELLLQFGLPKAFTFGAAMEQIFRQAAAAGLVSLVAGTGEPLQQEPAMALEDMEFTLRNGAPQPVLGQLRRGNVATATAVPSFRGKPRVLIVSPYLPFPLSHGGAVRIYNLCRELAADVDFILVCFREVRETVHYVELHKVFREVHVVDIDEKAADAAVPQQVHEYRNSAMAALIARLCQDRSIDLVQLEYTQMAEYRTCAGSLPVLLVEHDITFSLHQQLAESTGSKPAGEQFHLWQDFERKALAEVPYVWTMSGQDRELALQNGAATETTLAVPNGVDLARFQVLNKTSSPPSVLFVGSFRHLPNLLAFEALRDTIFPEVRRAVPNARLHVVAGPDHEQAASLAGKANLLLPQPGISMEGFVEDVRPAYRECNVVVIPLPVSAGTNIKLMEAMACGRAVVSTPVGCAGLELRDGCDLLIRSLGPTFSAAIAHLLLDTEGCRKMGKNARQTAEHRFGWDSIAAGALAHYRQILRHGPV